MIFYNRRCYKKTVSFEMRLYKTRRQFLRNAAADAADDDYSRFITKGGENTKNEKQRQEKTLNACAAAPERRQKRDFWLD